MESVHAHLRDAREPRARREVDAGRLVRRPARGHAQPAHHVQRQGLDAGHARRQQERVARRRARSLRCALGPAVGVHGELRRLDRRVLRRRQHADDMHAW